MPTILFTCTANRFRSPVAAACFKKELLNRNLNETWHVLSAGTWTTDGLPAISKAILGARRLGIEISNHRSTTITASTTKDADLILVMEQGQKEALGYEFPDSAHKVHLLTEAASGISYDIPDPELSSEAEEICSEINELVHRGFDRICNLALLNETPDIPQQEH